MRLRKKWWARDFILENRMAINHIHGKDAICKGNWEKIFKNNNPIYLEIGCGMGKFAKISAENNPDINYIAIEFKDEVVVNAIKLSEDAKLNNIKFIVTKAEFLLEYFEESEVSRIYINFCNPWPKRIHAHRRLIHTNFLNMYRKILTKKAQIHFKTDYDDLFEIGKKYFKQCNFKSIYSTEDLTNSDYSENIRTEYEEKFISNGKNINFSIYEIND